MVHIFPCHKHSRVSHNQTITKDKVDLVPWISGLSCISIKYKNYLYWGVGEEMPECEETHLTPGLFDSQYHILPVASELFIGETQYTLIN